MTEERFDVLVERQGINYHIVIQNRAGRRWIKKGGAAYPDNLGEYAIELKDYLNRQGGKVDKNDYVEMPRIPAPVTHRRYSKWGK